MIKIDMKMPSKCDECVFCTCPWNDYECVATGRGDVIDDVDDVKPDWCPLIEDAEVTAGLTLIALVGIAVVEWWKYRRGE